MSAKRKHSRRLSLFGLGASHLIPSDSGEDTPRPNTAASITFSISTAKQQANEKSVPLEAQRAPIRRKLSKKRKATAVQKPDRLAPSPPPSTTESYTFSNTQLSELSHESDIHTDQRRPSLKRKTSMNVRAALSSIFIPKPSRKSVVGILDGIEGIAGGKAIERREEDEKRASYCYESRSPTPPSPEIRPPSGLGQIASSIDLSTYVQEECEASARCLSQIISRTPSVIHFAPNSPSDNTTTTGTPETRSLSSRELFYHPLAQEPSAPSDTLLGVLNLSMSYFPLHVLSSLASANRKFLRSARLALYSNIDSDDVGEDEGRRRGILRTIASNSDIANMVKSFRWSCLHPRISPSSSSLNANRSIRRRQPTFSISLSPEELVLPRILMLIPNLETLVLQQPDKSILQAFVPAAQSPQRSPSGSPVSSSSQMPPILLSLRSLTLSGRTTLSTTFGSVLVRFLELHPGIRELNLPDVFCLPNVHILTRHSSLFSSNSSSPLSSPTSEDIPPVPPLPPSFAALKDKEPPPPMLPNLKCLTAPLSLATQLVPGRPLYSVNVELTTSLYEGLRPAEVARALANAKETLKRCGDENGKDLNWRAARHSRRFGLGACLTPPATPLPSPGSPTPGDEPKSANWKAARQARRAGITDNNRSTRVLSGTNTKQVPTLRELRLRCTGKVDSRTIGRVLIAFGKELGEVLEVLAIEWTRAENDLHNQLTLALPRFTSLKRLEVSSSIDSDSDGDAGPDLVSDQSQKWNKSETDLEVKIEIERNLVEHWSRTCPLLSHIEFPSGRIWRAS